MAEKKEVVTLMNRGKRHYDTVGADGKPVRHSPGASHEYTPEQAAQFDPKDMVDLSKVPGAVDKEALRKENVALKAENAALKERLKALEPEPAAEAPAADAPAEESAAEAEPAGDGRRRKK